MRWNGFCARRPTPGTLGMLQADLLVDGCGVTGGQFVGGEVVAVPVRAGPAEDEGELGIARGLVQCRRFGLEPALGANPEIGPIALSLGYLPETVGKCRRAEDADLFGWKKKLDNRILLE